VVHSPARIAFSRFDFGRRVRRRNRRTGTLLQALVLVASGLGESARGQTPVNTYFVNDGTSNSFEPTNAEIAPDLGGMIPFERYLDTNSTSGHYFARQWPAGSPTFFDVMRAHWTDLSALNQEIVTNMGSTFAILPFKEYPQTGYVAEIEGHTSIDRFTWWSRPVRMWPYRLNGAPVLICVRMPYAGPPVPTPNSNPSLLFVNYAGHPSAFGTNKNRTDVTLERGQEFLQPDPEAGWGGQPGPAILGIHEQALENGDVVVFCQEIYSASLWYTLQTTMAAESFVRNQFVPGTLSISTSNIGYSYLEGGSWGGIVSNFLALLQPHIYAASGGWTITDYPFAIGDMREFTNFQYGSLGMLAPASHVLGGDFGDFYEVADLLNIRFDSGTNPQWDLAAFAANRRPGDLKVKVYGFARNEDVSFNGFWSLDDKGSNNPNFDGRFRKFFEHSAAWGIVPGKNEYAFFQGNEWANVVKAGAATSATNIDLVPTTPAPSGSKGVWPDPYSHTLRHDATHGATPSGSTRLTPIDLGPAGYPNQPSSIKTLGQGVWPGYRDSMRMVDIDGDGKAEVVFGNLDGFIHDLELGNDANDPRRLDDQFKSQYLGRQIFASAGTGSGTGTAGYFADSRGCVWKVSYNGGITVGTTPLIQPDNFNVYDGEVPYIYVGNFDGTHGGKEILLLNRFLDWAIFDEFGAQLSHSRLQRNTHDIGPGQACQADVDGDGDLELLVPAYDGHVWTINPGRGNSQGFALTTKPDALISTANSGAPRSLYRIDAANFGGGSSPTHFLVFGRNDDLNDSNPSASTSVMMLYAAGTPPTLLAEMQSFATDEFSEAMSFAWITPPAYPATTAQFVVSGGAVLQKHTIDLNTTNIFTCNGTCPIVDLTGVVTNANAITSIVAPPGPSANYIVVAVSTGRFYVLDSNLSFLRTSWRETGTITDPTFWPSNRSLAQCMTTDLVQESHGVDADLYFADYGTAFRDVSGVKKYRFGRIHIPIGAGSPSFVPYLSDIKNPAVSDLARGANRTLLYRDLDGDGHREAHVFAETGTAYKDLATNVVREFCTYSYAAPFNYDATLGAPYNGRISKGGNVFEYFDPPSGSIFPGYNYLSGFYVPRDSTTPFEDFGGNDWWYARVGSNRLSGQISCYTQSGLSIGYGDAMKTAMIRPDSSTSTPVPHVVVGTNGGYVYAIRPGSVSTGGGACPSQLGFASNCMGSFIIGMDVGDLDGDPDQEIVVGEWMDKGTYVDWLNGNAGRNRAHLHILDPLPPSSGVGTFAETVLTGDDLLGLGNGIGAGVTGVRIDDFNADGAPDLWCTDAIGHIYLFKAVTGGLPWSCVYRSQDLGTCPGCYNQIYAMKDANHKTVKLIVVSSGYVMAFNVDPNI